MRPFIASALLLVVATVFMQPVIAGLTAAYHKEPIGIRLALEHFDAARLPSFAPAPDDALPDADGDPDALDMLFAMFRYAPAAARPRRHDDVLLFVTYYSDPRERVPHTPEVCYRQSGAIVKDVRSITVPTPDLPGRPEVAARVVDLEHGGVRRVVVYVLCSNGRLYDSREQVRLAVGWPGDRRIYFSKIEAAAEYTRDADRAPAIERCAQMLGEALPVLLTEHFPTREALLTPADGDT